MSDAVSPLNVAPQGRYAIERKLGEGGMATVYLADDLKHERKVALKVLRPELAAVGRPPNPRTMAGGLKLTGLTLALTLS